MKTVVVKIPFPPSVNHLWIITRGRKVINKKYKAFIDSIATAFYGRESILDKSDFYEVSIIAFPGDRRKRDLDNLFKAILDALTRAHVWKDDCQVVKLNAIKGPAAKEPFVIVKISAFVYPTDKELIPEHWGEKTREYKWTKDTLRRSFYVDRRE